MTTIGFLELTSISRGVFAADQMAKSASVDLITSKPTCPGKYIILISGDVGSVKTAIKTGIEAGANFVVDDLIIPNVHEQVIPAINDTTPLRKKGAIGVAEYFSVTGAIIGADAAAKSADISLMEARLGVGIGGKSFLTLSGDVSAVESAIKAATLDAINKGLLVDCCVIPSPTDDIYNHMV